MKHFAVLQILLSSLAISRATSQSSTASQTTPATGFKVVTYYSPIATLPPLEEDYTPIERLELRQAAGAQPAAAQAAAAQPAAAQPAAVQPAAVQPVAGAAPAVGVGGAGAVPAAAQPASVNPGQVSPVTTVNIFSVVGGVTQQVPIVYTQKFSSIPSQGPTPAKGVIGLGTITGTIGAARTAEAKKGSAPSRIGIGCGAMAIAVVTMLTLWV